VLRLSGYNDVLSRQLKANMKSIVSAPFKKQLLEICGSEEKLGILESLAWNHLAMEHECPSAGCNWQAFARNVVRSNTRQEYIGELTRL
jgi:hypothetical protein